MLRGLRLAGVALAISWLAFASCRTPEPAPGAEATTGSVVPESPPAPPAAPAEPSVAAPSTPAVAPAEPVPAPETPKAAPQRPPETPAKVSASAPPAPPAAPPVRTAGVGSCQPLYERIRSVVDAIPADMSGMQDAEADRLAGSVEGMIASTKTFEAECAAGDPIQLAEVRYSRAKGTFLMSERYRYKVLEEVRVAGVGDPGAAVQDRMRAYLGDVRDAARAAFDALPEDHPWRPRSLQLIGQASADAGDHETALGAYRQLEDLYPGERDLDRILLAQARACLDSGKLDEGVGICERIRKEFPDRESYYYAGELLWKLHHTRGDLDALWSLVETVETVYPVKLASGGLSGQVRDRVDLFLSFNGFRKGYVLFARCQLEAADRAFREHVAAGEKSASPANPAKNVTIGRSRDNLDFLEKVGGKPAPKELALEWITGDRVQLADSKGKAVAIVFRGVGDQRSIGFLAPLWSFARENPDVEMAVVSYLRSGEDVDLQAGRMREELAAAGYDGPSGLDPDLEGKSLFRSYRANVGSATFVIVSPDGAVTWFQQDPREIDTTFAKRLIERRLAGACGPGE